MHLQEATSGMAAVSGPFPDAQPACSGASLRILSAARALSDRSLCEGWDALAAHAAEPNVFAERWYLDAAVTALDPSGEVELAVFEQGGVLLGLLPMFTARRYARLPLRTRQNWLNHNAFLGVPLVAGGRERDFWRALLTHLDRSPRGALFLHLTGITLGGPLAAALEEECRVGGRLHAVFQRERRALLERGLAPDAYLEAALRSKKRKELRRQHNRLGELGRLMFERTAGDAGLETWIAEFLALERRGWKGANGSALDCARGTRDLFADALRGAAAAGRLELLALRLDGHAIAMLVNFLAPPGAFSFKTAFDEDYARYSPGVLLQIHNLDLLERPQIHWCDSCAAQDHPMIDSIWLGRRAIGRYSVAIGGRTRRAAFATLLAAEWAKGGLRRINERGGKGSERKAA